MNDNFPVEVFVLEKGKQDISNSFEPFVHFYERKVRILSLISLPFPVASRYNYSLVMELEKSLRSTPGIVIIEGLQSALIWEQIPWNVRQGCYSILRLHNIESKYFVEMASAEKTRLKTITYKVTAVQYKQYEAHIFKMFNEIHAISSDEVQYLHKLFPEIKNRIKWVPPLVDKFYENNEYCPNTDVYNIGYFGDMRLPINLEGVQWFIKEVLPIVRIELKEVQFHVAGLGSEGLINKPGVVVHGFVDDLDKFVDDMTIIVAPVRYGTGVKIKVIDAITYGKPLVTTSIGIEGTDETIKNFTWICDDSQTFAKAILSIYDNYEEACNKAENARRWVASNYNAEEYLCIFHSIVDKLT